MEWVARQEKILTFKTWKRYCIANRFLWFLLWHASNQQNYTIEIYTFKCIRWICRLLMNLTRPKNASQWKGCMEWQQKCGQGVAIFNGVGQYTTTKFHHIFFLGKNPLVGFSQTVSHNVNFFYIHMVNVCLYWAVKQDHLEMWRVWKL